MSANIEGVTINTSGGTIGYGIGNKLLGSKSIVKRTLITVTGGSSTRYGISAVTSSDIPEMRGGVNILITNSSIEEEDRGVYVNGDNVRVENSQVRATDALGIGIEAGGAIVDNSIIKGDDYTVFAGVATIGASRLDGGAVSAGTATCAGVYDESFTFYASTCP